jgi:predicted alpha/beta-fold hydrolase
VCAIASLSKIAVPCLIINALDDPFIDEKAMPDVSAVGTAPVQLKYYPKGGHCGFLTRSSKGIEPSPTLAKPLAKAGVERYIA